MDNKLWGVVHTTEDDGTSFFAVIAENNEAAMEAVVTELGIFNIGVISVTTLEALLGEQYQGLAILGTV